MTTVWVLFLILSNPVDVDVEVFAAQKECERTKAVLESLVPEDREPFIACAERRFNP